MGEPDVEAHLAHYGVKGMRWGVRRRGANRVDMGTKSEDHQKAATLKKKHFSELTNEELKTLNQRLQLEQQFKSLNQQTKNGGQKFAEKVLVQAGSQAINSLINAGVKSGMKAAGLDTGKKGGK